MYLYFNLDFSLDNRNYKHQISRKSEGVSQFLDPRTTNSYLIFIEKSLFINMIVDYFFCFLGGIICGFVFNLFLIDEPPKIKRVNHFKESFEIKEKFALAEIKKIRILCMLNTSPSNHRTRAVHIKQTWGKHCDKLVFASTLTDLNLNAIGFNMTNEHEYVFGKQKLMMQYVNNNFLNQYDWFYKADDDTFASIENLRYLLSAYSPEYPIFFGYKFFTPFHRWGYFSGGAGTLKVFA